LQDIYVLKVLIADDSSIMRRRLIQIIDDFQLGYQLYEAHDFNQTMKGISDIRPDVLILDICMPGGSGIDVLKTITPDTRPRMIIVFTNYAYPQYSEKCIKLGADYFFDKSVDIERLVEAIQSCHIMPELAGTSNHTNQ
jgi:DNA-binding NarL/FixJ family response regulator